MKTIIPSLLLLLSLGLAGRTLYVDTQHPQASDSNPGSESLPLKTIQKAADMAQIGDEILVKPGRYDERVVIRNGGTTASKVIFRSLVRRTAQVVHGFDLRANDVQIVGFDISHDVGGWQGNGIWLAGHRVSILDNYIHDVPGNGIRPAWGNGPGIWEDVVIAHNHIYGCNAGLVVAGKRWLVEENEIERLVRPASGGGDADYFRFFGQDHVIRRNFMHGTRKEEIGTSHTDLFQTFVVNEGENAQNILVEGNLGMDFFHQGFMADQSRPAQGLMADITFRGNVFVNSSSWNICAVGIQNLTIINNTFYNYAIHGVGFRDSDTTTPPYGCTGTIKNNIFASGGGSYWKDPQSSYACGHNLTHNLRSPGTPAPSDLVNQNPLFVNPADPLGPDGLPFTADDGLRLQASSPAIAAGEGGVDIGAYIDGPALIITSPNGGEVWPKNHQRIISWIVGAYDDTPLRIELLQNGNLLGLIATVPASPGSYLWTVGTYQGGSITAGSGYKIRVRTADGAILAHEER